MTVCKLRLGSANVIADSEAEEPGAVEDSAEVCLASRVEGSNAVG